MELLGPECGEESLELSRLRTSRGLLSTALIRSTVIGRNVADVVRQLEDNKGRDVCSDRNQVSSGSSSWMFETDIHAFNNWSSPDIKEERESVTVLTGR